jgi:hypothetical protein
MSSPPDRVPLIQNPAWLRARGRPSSGSGSPTPDPQQWIRDMAPYFSSDEDQKFLKALIDGKFVVTAFTHMHFEDYRFEKGEWKTIKSPADGCTIGRQIDIVKMADAAETASVLYHEIMHAGQDPDMPENEREYQAYLYEDEFRMRHGMPPVNDSFRPPDGKGKVTDPHAIRQFVNAEYPGIAVPAPDGSVGRIIGHRGDQTRILLPDGETIVERPTEEGDAYGGEQMVSPDGAQRVDLRLLLRP